MLSEYIQVEWSAPDQISAFSTTRIGGHSLDQYAGLNLAEHVGDNDGSVVKNRCQLISDLKLKQSPLWLEQTHSVDVVDANIVYKQDPSSSVHTDASFSSHPDQICVVMTADCLPILFCNHQGTWVAAVHAGWRGLANGIIQNTIDCYCGYDNHSKHSGELIAWLGPVISQKHFEVGHEVRDVFVKQNSHYAKAFIDSKDGKFYCDLTMISRTILTDYGIRTYGGGLCTFSDSDQFYSYRRDGQTGRMASLIWINQ